MREFLFAIGMLVIIALLVRLTVRTGEMAKETKSFRKSSTKVVKHHTREIRVIRQRSPIITVVPTQTSVTNNYPTIPGPMPNRLQWWEKKTITNVAKVFAKGDNLQRFRILLGVQIEDLKICPGISETKCTTLVGMVMG